MIFPTVSPSPENGSLFSGICVQLFHIGDLPYAQWPGLLLMAYGEAIKSSFLHPFAMHDIFTRIILTPLALFFYGGLAMVAADFGMIVYIGSKFLALTSGEGQQMVASDVGYTVLMAIAVLVWVGWTMWLWAQAIAQAKKLAEALDRKFFAYGKPLLQAVNAYAGCCKMFILLGNVAAIAFTFRKKPKAAN